MKRRELLLKDGLYKELPWTCVLFIEEIFSNIEGTDFRFGASIKEISINYKDSKGNPITEWCPIDEINGWSFYYDNTISYFTFFGFGMEEKLKNYFNKKDNS